MECSPRTGPRARTAWRMEANPTRPWTRGACPARRCWKTRKWWPRRWRRNEDVFSRQLPIFSTDGTEETDERGHVVTRGDVRGTLKEIPAGAAVVRIDMSSEGFARLRGVSCGRFEASVRRYGARSDQHSRSHSFVANRVPILQTFPCRYSRSSLTAGNLCTPSRRASAGARTCCRSRTMSRRTGTGSQSCAPPPSALHLPCPAPAQQRWVASW